MSYQRPKTPAQKVGEWQMVYRAVRDEVAVPWERAIAGASFSDEAADRILVDLDRTAAIVAAMLVGQNVRLPVEEIGE